MDTPRIIMVFGLPGSGKSYFAERLAEKINAEYISSDRLRKGLFPKRTYSHTEKARVYEAMLEKMQEAVANHKNVVLDATFHKAETRRAFLGHPGVIQYFIEIRADMATTRERLKQNRPYSEADYTVYQLIRREWEPMSGPHLILMSTDSNIEDMLKEALQYLNDGQRTDR